MSVAVVTDSTACLPATGAGVTVVPLHVSVGEGKQVTAREISPEEIAETLARGKERASTSRPSPGELLRAYRRAAEDGATSVLSVHLSGQISGTVEAARLAAAEMAGELDVVVVDSRQVGLALGYAVASAVRAVASGAGVDEAAEVARTCAAASRVWFYVHTLEHLRRGGRVGTAAALLGSALAIKPLLALKDGEVALEERVRTRAKALARLVDHAAARADELGAGTRLAVHHLAALDGARDLQARLTAMTGYTPEIVELDPVISVHAGPGTLGVVVAPPPGG